MFYLVFESLNERNRIIHALKEKNIYSVFHYLSLHKSPYYESKYTGGELPETDRYSDCLLRLPLYYELNPEIVITAIKELF